MNKTVNDVYVDVPDRGWKASYAYMTFKRFCKNKAAVFGLICVAVVVLMCAFADFIAPYSNTVFDPANAQADPSWEHLLGTDTFGRDVLTRILYGGRYTLGISLGSECLSIVFIILFGAVAGYFGGWVDNLIMRACDVIQSIPGLLLCICVSQAMGTGVIPTMIALSVGGIPVGVRVLRASLLNVREREFIEAAQACNCSKGRIMLMHLVPNCLSPVIVNFTSGLGVKMMTSASLSYLGLGIQEPMAEWGAMISAGKGVFRYHPGLVLFPGAAIAIVVLSYNLIGNGLRDALDPKLRD